MSANETINRIRGALGEHILAFTQKSRRRACIDIAPETVHEASSVMFEEIGARLQIATGVDTPAGIEVMYHWALDGEDCVVTVRATVDRNDAVLESIAEMCPAAEWIEREIWELLGVEFEGHPDLRHLLLDDSWPEGNYPLRKRQFADKSTKGRVGADSSAKGRVGADSSAKGHVGADSSATEEPERAP
jgi:Ni,Fe-hydrogenase III component G